MAPIEKPAELVKFAKESEKQGGLGHLADLLQLDAGLRFGEAIGLRWCDIWWGRDHNDTTRALRIAETRPRARHVEGTKAGRIRRVAMSRRLRSALRARWMLLSQPSDESRVLEDMDPSNYRQRHFRKVCEKAELGHRRPLELRDAFASHLLTAGTQLGYVSEQLDHADVSVTAQHYERWVGGSQYREPIALGDGEVPADLLSRIGDQESEKTLVSV